jgi:hypothetical protein
MNESRSCFSASSLHRDKIHAQLAARNTGDPTESDPVKKMAKPNCRMTESSPP